MWKRINLCFRLNSSCHGTYTTGKSYFRGLKHKLAIQHINRFQLVYHLPPSTIEFPSLCVSSRAPTDTLSNLSFPSLPYHILKYQRIPIFSLAFICSFLPFLIYPFSFSIPFSSPHPSHPNLSFTSSILQSLWIVDKRAKVLKQFL